MESTRGEAVVHLAASDVRKTPARGDETSVRSEPGVRGCTVEGTLFTGKVAGEFRINLGEDVVLGLAPVRRRATRGERVGWMDGWMARWELVNARTDCLGFTFLKACAPC